MHWLSFLVGGLVGWLISWLIDYLVCRPRRTAAQPPPGAGLEHGNEEFAALRAQLAGYHDLQARLDSANAELDALRAQVAAGKDLQARVGGADAEIDLLKAQLAGMRSLQMDLVSWKARATEQGLEIERLNTELAARPSAATPAPVAPAATAATEVEPSPAPSPETGVALGAPGAERAAPDDLTRIEGIGPKISALLNQNGLHTFAQLAAGSVQQLQSILDSAGPRFRLADPQTWPEQAGFARDGKWDALQAFQDTLKGGRTV
jgi:predicted flap endonuclease-1-like 5' DNA nuclease